jgi:hypothetical protein
VALICAVGVVKADGLPTASLASSPDVVGPPIMFPDTAVGDTSTSPCVKLCFGTNCSAAGTVTLDKGVSPPFSAVNYTVGSSSACGGTATTLPATLAAGQALYFDVKFSPTQNGSFSDSLVLSGLSFALTGATPSSGSGCVANATTLCINQNPGDGRFKIQVSYSTSQGGGLSGSGNAIALSSLGVTEGGLFWFFSAANPEMLIKIIDGCSLGGHFWVFFAATTNVGFTVTVTDTSTGHQAVYHNADLTAALPVQDTSSALVCP